MKKTWININKVKKKLKWKPRVLLKYWIKKDEDWHIKINSGWINLVSFKLI